MPALNSEKPAWAGAARTAGSIHATRTRRLALRCLHAFILLFAPIVALAQPVFSGSPTNGAPIMLYALTPSGTASTNLTITNVGTGSDLFLNPQAVTTPITTSLNSTQSLMPGESRSFTVTCTPTAAGIYNANLVIQTNDAAQPTVTYQIMCTAATAGPSCPVIGVAGNGQTQAVGTTFQPMQVKQARFAAVAPTTPVVFTWQITSGNATFQANGATSFSQTVNFTPFGGALYDAFASTAIVAGNTPGTVTVTVNSSDCTSSAAHTFNATIAAGGQPFRIVAGEGNGATVAPGQTLTLGGTIELNAAGRPSRPDQPLGGVSAVNLQINGGDARFSNGTSSISALVNQTTKTFTADVIAGSQLGDVVIDATSPLASPAQFRFTVGERKTIRVVSGANQQGRPGEAGQPLVVEVLNANNQPVAGEKVFWQVAFGFGVTLASDSSVTDANGRASMNFTFGNQPTTAVIDARLGSGDGVRFQVSSTLGGLRLISGDAQLGVIGSQGDPLVFQLSDDNGQAVVGQTVTFAVAEGAATLLNTSEITDAQGRASARFRFGATPGQSRIQAAAGNATAFATVNALGGVLSISSGNGQSGATGARLAQPLVVQLAQAPAQAKALGGVAVTWSVLSGGGTLSSTTSLTGADGRASNEFTLGAQAGIAQIQASIPGATPVVFTATGVDNAPVGVRFEIASGNNQALPTNTPSAPLVVRVRNAQGQAVAGALVNWRVTPAVNGSANPATSTTNAQGEASTVVTLGLPGGATVIATLPNVPGSGALNFALNGGVRNLDGLTDNQRRVAGAIDSACPNLAFANNLSAAQQDLLQRCSELVVNAGTRPGDVRGALNQMLADEAGAQGDAALSTMGAQFDNLKARIAALRAGSSGINIGGLSVVGGGGALPLSFLPSAILGNNAEPTGEAGAEFSRWGFFATGTIGRGDRNADSQQPGFEFDTYGLTAGVDYRYSDALVLGMAVGYNNNNTDIGANQGSLKTSGYSISGYSTFYRGNSFYTDAVLTWGRNNYDIDRRIRYTINGLSGGTTTVDQTASASPDGDQVSLAMSLGHDFNRGGWTFGPYLRANYTKIDFDPYVERMSNPSAPGAGLAMAVSGRELKSLEGVIGGKASFAKSTSWGVLMPNVTLEWLHEFEDDPQAIVTRFVNDPTNTLISIDPGSVDTDYFNLGLGLSGIFANGRSAFLYYEHRAGQADFSQDSLALGVRIEF